MDDAIVAADDGDYDDPKIATFFEVMQRYLDESEDLLYGPLGVLITLKRWRTRQSDFCTRVVHLNGWSYVLICRH